MKKVLYITNIEVPYKVKFFNGLSEKADLTVLYERRNSSNRNSDWTQSEKAFFTKEFLEGIKIGNENAFSFDILKYLKAGYDEIIISCINSPVQLFAILYMKIKKMKYVLSFDGELFIGKGFKSFIKRKFITGADKYLIAGKKSAESLYEVVKASKIYPYFFSSYSNSELEENSKVELKRDRYVLVVGQYFDYKGLDIAVRIAKRDSSIKYKFVGMGNRTALFEETEHLIGVDNIEVIPFLSKDELNVEYQRAALLLLPSRQECWGLVINEAASFGTPIVSTTGSGAAVEFLSEYDQKFLFDPADENGIYQAIKKLLESDNKDFSDHLKRKSLDYSIEKMISVHEDVLEL